MFSISGKDTPHQAHTAHIGQAGSKLLYEIENDTSLILSLAISLSLPLRIEK